MKIRTIVLLVFTQLFVSVIAFNQTIDKAKKSQEKTVQVESISTFKKDYRLFSFCYGFPSLFNESEANWSTGFVYNSHKSFGPMMLRYEVAMSDVVSIAPLIQYANQKWEGYWNNGSYTPGTIQVTGYGIGLMGFYHFNKWVNVPQLDVYAGPGLHILFNKWKGKTTSGSDEASDTKNHVNVGAVIGARYYSSDNMAFYLEAGNSGYSTLNIGVTLKAK